jgi:hypothetical protein
MEKRYLIKHLSQQSKKVRLRRKLSTGLRRDLRPERGPMNRNLVHLDRVFPDFASIDHLTGSP